MDKDWRNELITKGAAFDALKDNTFRLTLAEEQGCEGHVVWHEDVVFADVLEKALLALPSAQPEHNVRFNDADHVWIDGKQYISLRRFMEAVKDARKDAYKRGKSKGITKGLAMAQRIKGRWIHDGCDIPHGVDWMHCSVCGRREPYVPAAMTNYCPGCGTEMETELQ